MYMTKPSPCSSKPSLKVSLIDNLKHETTIVYDLNFDTIQDEYQYMINRTYHYLDLVQIALRPDANKDQRLVELLDDINDTKVADPEDDLLGTLLHELYPRAIDPARLLNYLHVPKNPDYLGRYVLFWSHLAERSPAAALAELLDELAVRKNDLQPALDSISLRPMSSRLLARGLETAGDTSTLR